MNVLPQWMRGYRRRSVRLDVVAGLSFAAFAIPESLAYASLADLPPISGLYCYQVAGIAYAFGSSPPARHLLWPSRPASPRWAAATRLGSRRSARASRYWSG